MGAEMRRLGSIAGLTVALAGCGKKEEPKVHADVVIQEDGTILEGHRGETPRQKSDLEDGISYAELASEKAEPPARYTTALPPHERAAEGDWSSGPPAGVVGARLCAGDAQMQAKALAAVQTAVNDGASLAQLRKAYEQPFFGYCGAKPFCDWLGGIVDSDSPASVKALFWFGLEHCDAKEVENRFARSDAPPEALMAWFGSRFPVADKFDARVAQAVRNVLPRASTDPQTRLDIVDAAATFAMIDDQRALTLAQEAYAASTDGQLRRRILFAMAGNKNPDARQFFSLHCKEVDDRLCEQGKERGSGGFSDLSEPADPVKRVLDGWESAQAIVASQPHQRAPIVAALETCARDVTQHGAKVGRCLASLAGLDRARAVEVARAIDTVPENGAVYLLEIAVTLDHYPEPGSLEAKLDGLGFPDRGRGPTEDGSGDETPAITAKDVLVERGYVHWFDTETGMFPNEHHLLMDTLASMVSPDLDRIIFEEKPPEMTEDFAKVADGEGYTLIAYMDGKRYTLTAQDLGDWYDLDAVLGMLNSLARERGVGARFVPLPTGDQTASVVAANQTAIAGAREAELIRIGGALAAVEAGKGFEDEVLRQLRSKN